MMGGMDVTEIRARLDAVAGVDWSVRRDADEHEYYTLWTHVGPAMFVTGDPESELPGVKAEAEAEHRALQAVVEFVAHAAEDMRALLARLDGEPS